MTEQTASKVPQIRFKGFKGEWSEMPMGQLLTFKNGYNASKSQYGRGEKFINVLDIIRNDYITYEKIIGRVSIPLKEFAKNEVIYGDILFQRSSETLEEVGQANVYLDKIRPATFGGFVIRGRPLIDFNPSFFNATLKSPKSRRDITSRSGGSTRYNVGQGSLEASLVRIAPDLLEQGKVADFVMSVDRLIGLHQRKHDKLVTLKKAMLQKMFPQPGAATPEVRFKGFSGDWVEEKLGKLGAFSKGQGYSKSDLTTSGTPIVLYGRLYVNYQTTISGVDTFVVEKKGAVKSVGKEVIVPASGETAEDIARASAIVTEGIILGGDLNIIYPYNELDSCFLALTLSNGKPQTDLAKRAQGKTVVHVRKADIESILIPFPKLPEQQKIGTYFRTLDSLISKHATQLQKLQQLKSACLQRMFV